MQDTVIWWVLIQVVAGAALPLTFRLFRRLPDRGYALAKPLGLLLVSYLFWLLATLGLLRNTWGSMLFCLVVLAIAGVYLYFRERTCGPEESLRLFLRDRWRLVLVTELLFLVGFAGWALYRAYNPAISATEKPMEFAFLNGILRSEHFPPLDPWLSGFGISYYYFGYVMIAVLTRLSGVAPSIAFNLAIATLFAWTLTGAFSLVYNLVAGFGIRRNEGYESAPHRGAAIGFGLLAAWVTAVAGNLEGLLEVLHTRGLGPERFWQWLDIKNLVEAPVTGLWYPTDNWWWWRASRVIHDRDLAGRSIEVIDEFPFFSFLLGDMHPHVLALPFVLVALGLALNLVFAMRDRSDRLQSGYLDRLWGDPVWTFGVYALAIGAIGFLNTWDLPIYLAVVAGAYAIRRHRTAVTGEWLVDSLKMALILALASFLLYLPFYAGFQSQAGGLLPAMLVTTRWQQLLVMFGLQLVLLAGFLAARWRNLRRRLPTQAARWAAVRSALYAWAGLLLAGFVGMLAAVVPLLVTQRGRDYLEGLRNSEPVRDVIGDAGYGELLARLLLRRLSDPWTVLLLALLLALAIVLLIAAGRRAWNEDPDGHAEPVEAEMADLSSSFAIWIALIGLLLVFSVEFVYLRDTFGTRMNTVFKFYYQAWVLMSLSGVYGLFYVIRGSVAGDRKPGRLRLAYAIVVGLLLAATAVYPFAAGYNKAEGFAVQPTLDGLSWMARYTPEDYDAIQWLNRNVSGAPGIVEATGGSYSQFGRVSASTGLPTVLGWGGHELQWRGNYDEAGKREPDIDQIYESFDPKLTLTLLDKYGISYVYVGPLERQKYPAAALAKFNQIMDVAYRNEGVTIYRRR